MPRIAGHYQKVVNKAGRIYPGFTKEQEAPDSSQAAQIENSSRKKSLPDAVSEE